MFVRLVDRRILHDQNNKDTEPTPTLIDPKMGENPQPNGYWLFCSLFSFSVPSLSLQSQVSMSMCQEPTPSFFIIIWVTGSDDMASLPSCIRRCFNAWMSVTEVSLYPLEHGFRNQKKHMHHLHPLSHMLH